MPGDRGRYPTRDEAAAYLRAYADHFDLPVRTHARVRSVRPNAPALYSVELADGGSLRARAVGYRRPDEFAGQRVVVVAAGNSAVQVAVELAGVADVTLATRSPLALRRHRPLGVDLHYWVRWSGLDRLPLGRRAASSVGVLDDGTYAEAVAAGRPERRPMFDSFTPDGVLWSDGTREQVDTVILATGYLPDLGYLPAAAFGDDGWPLHRRGISSTLPGLGFVGLPGQTGIASAMLRGVGPDARHVVRRLRHHLASAPDPRAGQRLLAEAT